VARFLLARPLAADAVGVVGIEVGAVSACEEKPGWVQATSLRARSSEIAWCSTRRASRRSRNSFITASASQLSSR